MGDPTPQEVLGSIDKGIRKAQKDYKKAAWCPICSGPEYLITVNIFYSLLKLIKGDSLTLEVKPKVLIEYLEEKTPSRKPKSVPPNLRPNGRADICLWHVGENRPRVIIEVKRSAEDWCTDTKDIDRVAGLLLRKKLKRFEFGIVASCLFVKIGRNRSEAEKNIRTKLKDIRQIIQKSVNAKSHLGVTLKRSIVKSLSLKGEYPEDGENWLWRPVVFKIYCQY